MEILSCITVPRLLFAAAVGKIAAEVINKYANVKLPVGVFDRFTEIIMAFLGAGSTVMLLLSIFVAYSEWLFYPHKSFLFSIANLFVATLHAVTLHVFNIEYL